MNQTPKPRGLQWLMSQPQSTQTAIVQDVLELSRIVAEGVFQQEVAELAGERYTRDKPHGGKYSRHGTNPGSIQIGNQRLPIDVPRVRNTKSNKCVELESIVLGVGTRNYHSIVDTTADAFGLSKSRISAKVVEQTLTLQRIAMQPTDKQFTRSL